MNAIEINNMSKIYQGGIKALESVSFNVPEGHIFGLLGPNGAGKTTLIKALLGIISASSGDAKILGESYLNSEVKKRVGYLPENHKYPLFLTGKEVLFYFGGLSGISDTELNKVIPKYLKLVSMEKWADTKIKKYSKGMMQRIGMAQALVTDPKLLFLDEPTDGIDPVGRREIHDIMRHLKEEGKTVFINSHMLAEIESVCDIVAILKKGKLVRFGTVEEITTQKENFIFQIEECGMDLNKLFESEPYEFIQESSTKLILSVKNSKELNQVIDKLRSNDILISTVQNVKSTLEDSFIEIVKEEN